MNQRNTGFTLIELMIVLVIAAILVAIAIPSYSQYVERSRRNDAQAALIELANFMERNFSNAGQYDKDAAGAAIVLPFGETPKGATGTDRYYTIALTTLNANEFELTATPVNGQADDPCGKLTLDQTGAEGVKDASKTAQECW